MRTAEEVLAYLESELDDTYKELDRWRFDEEECRKHRIAANNLEHLIEDIAEKIEADARNKSVTVSNCEPAKVLTSMPKKKTNFLDVYLDIFEIVVFVTSLFFIDDLIYSLIDLLNVPKGILQALIHYGYLLIHILSFIGMIVYKKIVKRKKR